MTTYKEVIGDFYIEVKGYWQDEESRLKYEEFAKTHTIQLIEKEEYNSLKETFKQLIPEWENSYS